MANREYRFRLKIGSAPFVDSNPIWNDETAFVTEGADGEMYFRSKLDVELNYLRADFDAIYAADIETEFRVLLQERVGGVWLARWSGKFWYTDIEFQSIENRTCKVKPDTFDLYDDLLTGLEKEFNLIELEPPTVSVTMLKQAVIQIYLPGSSFVANYTNDGIFYETPCVAFNTTPAPGDAYDPDNHNSLIDDYGFGINAPSGIFDWARVVIPGSSISPNVSGVYKSDAYTGDGIPNGSYTREDGVYTIQAFNTSPGNLTWKIVLNSGPTNVYATPEMPISNFFYGRPPHAMPSLTFTSLTSSSQVQGYLFLPYVRLLTTLEEVNGSPTVELDETDPIPHGTFTHALPLETANFIYAFDSNTNATRWGKYDEDALFYAGKYFVKPNSSETLMPVAVTTWTGASGWFYLDDDLRLLQQLGSEEVIIKDAYKLSDCIKVLLAEIQPLVGHDDNPLYSDFLYAAGTNPIRGDRKVPVIIPKTNVIVGNYDHPDKNEKIRLSEIIMLLRYFHNAYWHISESAMIIEHEDYYHNGKSYSAENVGTDLTTGIEPKTGLNWSYRGNGFKFEKATMPERIETNWMDKGSPQFDGYPIQNVSKYAQKGNIDSRSISRFTSDIDFIHVASNDITKDGFVFLECLEGELYYEVPFVTVVISADETYTMQNGYAALIYAHENYHRYNLAAKNVTLNKAAIVATTTKRSKVQEITFADAAEIDPYELIETELGVGRLKKMKRPINSNTVEATIAHNIE